MWDVVQGGEPSLSCDHSVKKGSPLYGDDDEWGHRFHFTEEYDPLTGNKLDFPSANEGDVIDILSEPGTDDDDEVDDFADEIA